MSFLKYSKLSNAAFDVVSTLEWDRDFKEYIIITVKNGERVDLCCEGTAQAAKAAQQQAFDNATKGGA